MRNLEIFGEPLGVVGRVEWYYREGWCGVKENTKLDFLKLDFLGRSQGCWFGLETTPGDG